MACSETLKGVRLKTKPITAATAMAIREVCQCRRDRPKPATKAVITKCIEFGKCLGPSCGITLRRLTS